MVKDTFFTLYIGDTTIHVSIFCYKKVGNTENLKFKVECPDSPQNEDLNKEIDDFESLRKFLLQFMEDKLINYVIHSTFGA